METLSKHFRTLTRVAMERHGFAQADLLSHWTEIAGENLASLCQPEKVKWNKADGKASGVLTVRAKAGRALDVQYAGPAMIERINRFMGYEAITAVKVVAETMAATVTKPPAVLREALALPESLANIPDPDLKASLLRLAQSLRRSPQHQD